MADLADYLVDGLDVEEHTAVFKATHNDVGGYQVPGRLVVVVEDSVLRSLTYTILSTEEYKTVVRRLVAL